MMPNYTYINTGRLFDLVLPKPVIDICTKCNPGDCSQFHFVQSMDSIYSHARDQNVNKPSVSVTTLADGSWNITNNKDIPANTDLNVKHVYIIIPETAKQVPEQPELVPEFEIEHSNEAVTEHENVPQPSSGLHEIPEMVQSTIGEPDDHIPAEEEPVPAEDHVELEDLADAAGPADHDYVVGAEVTNLEETDLSETEYVEEPQNEVTDTAADPIIPQKKGVACTICPSVVKDHWNLLKHIKRYHTEHPTCADLVEHIKPLLRVPCSLCGKVFGNPKILLEHEQKIHHNSIGATCSHCGKFFKTDHHLKMHIKYLHLRQPGTYLCDICPAKFQTKNVLREHIKYSHSSSDKSKKCPECDFTYAFNKQFYEHFTRVHAPKKHTCPYCDYKCATRWYMKKHMKNCAPKTVHMSCPPYKKARLHEPESMQLQAEMPQPPQEEAVAPSTQPVMYIMPEEDSMGTATEESQTWQIAHSNEDETETHFEVDTSNMVQVKQEDTKIIEVDGERHTRISLTGADGSQQTIELILPPEHAE